MFDHGPFISRTNQKLIFLNKKNYIADFLIIIFQTSWMRISHKLWFRNVL